MLRESSVAIDVRSNSLGVRIASLRSHAGPQKDQKTFSRMMKYFFGFWRIALINCCASSIVSSA